MESEECEVEKKIVSEEKSSREEVETRKEVEASQLEEAGDNNQAETSSSSFKFDQVNRRASCELVEKACDVVSSLSDELGVPISAESLHIDFLTSCIYVLPRMRNAT